MTSHSNGNLQKILMPAGVLFTFMKVAAAQSLPIETIFNQQGFELSDLLSHEYISVSCFESVLEALIESSPEKNFHIKFAQEFTISHIAGFEEFIITGSTSYETIHQVFSYKELFIPLLDVIIIEQGQSHVLQYASNTWHPISDKYYYSEILFTLIQCFGYRLLNFESMVESVFFRHAPRKTQGELEAWFKCPVYYDALHDIAHVKPGVLTENFNSMLPSLHNSIQKLIDGQFKNLMNINNSVFKVEKYISENLNNPEFNIGQLSRLMCCSSRTLQRILHDNHTSFKQIKQQIRVRRATELLQKTTRPLAKISEDLGFSSVSSFSRFFKALYGCTPKELRNME
jgi:AraC-like DNA-binding protein